MSNAKTTNTLDEDDTTHFNISEAQDKQPFYDLQSFVHELAPGYSPTIDRVLQGDDINTRDIHAIMDVFFDMLVPLYNRDGSIANPKMAHLHETIVGVGRQL